MHRKSLIDQLNRYARRHPGEAPVWSRFLAFVEGEPACFERRLEAGHVTGSAWIEDAAGERVLLVHHRKLDRWLQPGGHADGDGDVLRVALREAAEETGLAPSPETALFDLDIHPIPARGGEPQHLHYDVRYRMRAPDDVRPAGNHESNALRWFAIAEVARWPEESLARMARKSLDSPPVAPSGQLRRSRR